MADDFPYMTNNSSSPGQRALAAQRFYSDDYISVLMEQVKIDYIYEHLHERITVAILADAIGLNSSYLSTLFKKETGMAVSEYILDKRLDTAETMLKYSDMSISEIASILSFSSQSHLTEALKRRTGMTPKEYRNRFFRNDSLRGDR